jgi:hypothetical protein
MRTPRNLPVMRPQPIPPRARNRNTSSPNNPAANALKTSGVSVLKTNRARLNSASRVNHVK